MENVRKWLICPRCGSKTRIQICQNTKLINFPLFCPKCKLEEMVSVENFKLKII